MHVRITEQDLVHTPWHEWKKHFVLLLTMGSHSDEDARPVVELFEYITGVLGTENKVERGCCNRPGTGRADYYGWRKVRPSSMSGLALTRSFPMKDMYATRVF